MQFLKSIFEKFSKSKTENQLEKVSEPEAENQAENFFNPESANQKKLRKRKKLQGVIGALGLEDFWYSLTKEEQEALTRYEQGGLGADKNISLIKGKYDSYIPVIDDVEENDINISAHIMFFISNKIQWSVYDKNYLLTDKLISYIEEKQPAKDDLSLWHFYWQELAEYYYKLRDIKGDAIELSINYCLKDIENYPYYIKKISKKGEVLPFIKTFYRLMIIYEKQGRYEEAIKYCEMAINYGLEDNTKGGYKARLERLKKKLR